MYVYVCMYACVCECVDVCVCVLGILSFTRFRVITQPWAESGSAARVLSTRTIYIITDVEYTGPYHLYNIML